MTVIDNYGDCNRNEETNEFTERIDIFNFFVDKFGLDDEINTGCLNNEDYYG